MKYHALKRWGAGALCALLLATAGCAKPTTPQDPKAQFDALSRELFVDIVSADGISLQYALVDPSAYDIPETASTSLRGFTLEELQQGAKDDLELEQKLGQIDRAALTPAQQQTYDAIAWLINIGHMTDGLELYVSYNSSSNDAMVTTLPQMLIDYRIETEKDVEHYLALLSELPRVFQEGLTLEQQRAEAGLYMPERVMDEVVKNGRTFLSDPESHVMLISFEDRLAQVPNLDDAKKQDYLAKNRSLWLEQIVPAAGALLDGLDALRSSCRPLTGYAGMGEDGKTFYSYLALTTTGWEGTMEEMIAAVDDELAACLRMMFFAQNSLSGAYDNVIDYLSEPLDLGSAEQMLEQLRVKSETDFLPLGNVQYQVKRVPLTLQDSSAPAYYLLPPIDRATVNTIYINPSKQSEQMPQEVFDTLAHEGYPGHLYQRNYYVQTEPDPLRTRLSFLGYTEGWATYAAEWAVDWVGLNEEAASTLRYVNRIDSLLAARIDLGVHYEGWDLEQTAKYLAGFGISDAETADSVYLAVITDPTNPLPYVVGAIELRGMRLRAQKELGDAFDLPSFHQAVLDCGPAPFGIVNQSVDAYIAANKPAVSGSETQKAA